MIAEIIDNQIKVTPVPVKDIKNGLRVYFNKETETCTDLCYTDIKEGQEYYELPNDLRSIIKIVVGEPR